MTQTHNLTQEPPTVVNRTDLRLADFIRKYTEPIIREWSSFAKTLTPASNGMTALALRDHIEEMLTFVADDMGSPQTGREQVEKSHGGGPKGGDGGRSAPEIHAALRLEDRFDIEQMVAEYRALRASVVKLWRAAKNDLSVTDFDDLTRFNEAIDQAMMESIRYYTKTIDHSRNMFLGILGHDLRAPIGAASLCAQVMLHKGLLSPKQTSQVTLIIQSTTRANQIIGDILDLTRSGFGSDLPVTKAHIDMGLVSSDLVDEMRAFNVGRKITLETIGDMSGEWDRNRIGQIFTNLIGNAIQYSAKDTPVAVIVKGEQDELVLSIHNEGRPISRDEVVRIFDALARGTEDQGESTNLGLGLYITKKIVVSHHGTIDVTSSEEDGTRFTVRLPRH
jgi:signal transduction histidine kinase